MSFTTAVPNLCCCVCRAVLHDGKRNIPARKCRKFHSAFLDIVGKLYCSSCILKRAKANSVAELVHKIPELILSTPEAKRLTDDAKVMALTKPDTVKHAKGCLGNCELVDRPAVFAQCLHRTYSGVKPVCRSTYNRFRREFLKFFTLPPHCGDAECAARHAKESITLLQP
jgi:hypothetical protein